MGKSSSSSRKKRSRNSSLSRTRKRNKVKSKRSKSKKLRRQPDDSVSYSSDSDPRSLVSVSSSGSEDDYRSRRSRSLNRKDLKDGKKRARRRSSSRESSEDSIRLKKRRGSRRADDYEKKKRTSKKKRSRRDVNVRSRSRSRSCSTSRNASGSDRDEIGYEKRRDRSERKEKGGRSEKDKRGSKRSRHRSKSCSSYSRYDEGSDHPIEERMMEESHSRRLKSVITVVRQENESSQELITVESKEEIYDYDDYPSCRSNDSNDGCNKRELPQHNHTVSETKRPVDGEQREVSNIRMSSAEESGKDCKARNDEDGKNDDLRVNNNVSSAPVGFSADDMESILRQRALENLRKFREGLQTSKNPPITQIDKRDADGKTPSSVNTDPSQIKTPKAGDARVVSNVKQQIRQPPVGIDSATTLPKNDRKASDLHDDCTVSRTVESDVASPLAHVVPADIPRVEVKTANNSVSNKSKLLALRTRPEAPNTNNTQKQETASQETSQAKLVKKDSVNGGDLQSAQSLKTPEDNATNNSVSTRPMSVNSRIIRRESLITSTTKKQEFAAVEPSQPVSLTKSSVNEGGIGTPKTLKPSECGNTGGEVTNTHDSACDKQSSSKATSGDISSDKLEEQSKDGSQFQQKTMSVMRGGEMVQVSYQVYIPKRAPALSRRQLKR